jgi:PPP family 3-phenylpropionic acid transporter
MQTVNSIQRNSLFRIRLYYFIMTGAGGFVIPFIGLFYQRQGLTGTQIGLLGTVTAFTSLIAAPIWGRWSDSATDPRKPLQVAFIGSGTLYLLISRQDAFIWLALLTCLNGILGAGVDPMSDALAIDILKGQSKSGFGSIRLWGSLGWAVVVLFSGWLIERTSIISAFWGYAVMMVATVIAVNRLGIGDRQPKSTTQQNGSIPVREILGLIIQDRALIGLALAIGIVWFTRTGIYQFQAIYLDQLGARESLIGLASTLGALIELPGMLWADHLIRRYGSHRVLGSTMLLYALMNGFVVLYPSVGAIIAAAALGGIAFSFYSVGMVIFLSERAPLGQTATILAIYTSTLRGLISMLAAPLAGMVFDFVGAYWLYVAALAGSLTGALVFYFFVTGKRSQPVVVAK